VQGIFCFQLNPACWDERWKQKRPQWCPAPQGFYWWATQNRITAGNPLMILKESSLLSWRTTSKNPRVVCSATGIGWRVIRNRIILIILHRSQSHKKTWIFNFFLLWAATGALVASFRK